MYSQLVHIQQKSRQGGRRDDGSMKIVIEGEPKEIAALVLEVQERREKTRVHMVSFEADIDRVANSFCEAIRDTAQAPK